MPKVNSVQSYQHLFLLLNWVIDNCPEVSKSLKLYEVLKVVREKREDYHFRLILLRGELQNELFSIEKRILLKKPSIHQTKEEQRIPHDVIWSIERIFTEKVEGESYEKDKELLMQRFKIYTNDVLPNHNRKEIPSTH